MMNRFLVISPTVTSPTVLKSLPTGVTNSVELPEF